MLKSKLPELVYAASAFNQAVLSRCPTLHSVYKCTPFLTNGHLETILVAKLRKAPGVDYRREIILTKDGGAVAIDWEHVDDDGKVNVNRALSPILACWLALDSSVVKKQAYLAATAESAASSSISQLVHVSCSDQGLYVAVSVPCSN